MLKMMIADTFSEDQVAVVNGGLEFARYFPTLPWNHLVYTGSGAIGRQIMTAAAAKLVPVTLELGGKCPAIVAPDSVDLAQTIATVAGVKVIQIGETMKPGSRAMPFYVVVNPPDDLPLMRNEIFGPIKTYKTTQDAIAYVNRGDRPLGLYVFAKDRAFIDQVTQNTQSGGVAVNMIALQAGQPSMGFGGNGASGMGRHHGEEGFRGFSIARGYFERGAGSTIDWIFPLYGAGTRHLIDNVAYAPIGKQLVFALKRLPIVLMAKFR